jgi:ribonuclease P protein component
LQRAEGFEHVLSAKSIADKSFKICFSNNFKNNARLGIVASKKMLPRATDRNRVKRIIRETFRHHSIKACKLDLVVLVRRDYSQKVDAQIDNLQRLFSQVEKRCAE